MSAQLPALPSTVTVLFLNLLFLFFFYSSSLFPHVVLRFISLRIYCLITVCLLEILIVVKYT